MTTQEQLLSVLVAAAIALLILWIFIGGFVLLICMRFARRMRRIEDFVNSRANKPLKSLDILHAREHLSREEIQLIRAFLATHNKSGETP